MKDLDLYEPLEKVNGIVIKYRNKKNGKIISNIEYEMLKLKKLFG